MDELAPILDADKVEKVMLMLSFLLRVAFPVNYLFEPLYHSTATVEAMAKKFVPGPNSEHEFIPKDWTYLWELKPIADKLGVFSRQFLKAGTRILTVLGEVFRRVDFPVLNVNCVVSSSGMVICFDKHGSLFSVVRASCQANCKLISVWRGKEEFVLVETIRDVDKKEEVTVDFKYSIAVGYTKMECHCGQPKCRIALAYATDDLQKHHCRHCNLDFKTSLLKNEHLIIDHVHGGELFCPHPGCQYPHSFKHFSNYYRHMNQHHDGRDFQINGINYLRYYPCPRRCGYIAPSPSDWVEHAEVCTALYLTPTQSAILETQAAEEQAGLEEDLVEAENAALEEMEEDQAMLDADLQEAANAVTRQMEEDNEAETCHQDVESDVDVENCSDAQGDNQNQEEQEQDIQRQSSPSKSPTCSESNRRSASKTPPRAPSTPTSFDDNQSSSRQRRSSSSKSSSGSQRVSIFPPSPNFVLPNFQTCPSNLSYPPPPPPPLPPTPPKWSPGKHKNLQHLFNAQQALRKSQGKTENIRLHAISTPQPNSCNPATTTSTLSRSPAASTKSQKKASPTQQHPGGFGCREYAQNVFIEPSASRVLRSQAEYLHMLADEASKRDKAWRMALNIQPTACPQPNVEEQLDQDYCGDDQDVGVRSKRQRSESNSEEDPNSPSKSGNPPSPICKPLKKRPHRDDRDDQGEGGMNLV